MDLDLTTLDKMTSDFVSKYKNVLESAGKVATGALVASVDGDVNFDGRYINVSIKANEEWKYVEYGRKPGKFPNLEAIKSWISVKGLPRSNYGVSNAKYKGKLPTENQLTYLIGRKIARDGIPAGNYLSNLLKSTAFSTIVTNEMANMIQKAFINEMENENKSVMEVNI